LGGGFSFLGGGEDWGGGLGGSFFFLPVRSSADAPLMSAVKANTVANHLILISKDTYLSYV